MENLNSSTIENNQLIRETFRFWFTDHQHIRSPFPLYIQKELKKKSVEKFFSWSSKLDEKAKEEITDTMVGEKLEEIIFETAIELVKTEDEKLTIFYPFLPRINDKVHPDKNSPYKINEMSIVKKRSIRKEGDTVYMEVNFETEQSHRSWKTRFELPG